MAPLGWMGTAGAWDFAQNREECNQQYDE